METTAQKSRKKFLWRNLLRGPQHNIVTHIHEHRRTASGCSCLACGLLSPLVSSSKRMGLYRFYFGISH